MTVDSPITPLISEEKGDLPQSLSVPSKAKCLGDTLYYDQQGQVLGSCILVKEK